MITSQSVEMLSNHLLLWISGPLLQDRLINECTNSVDSNAAAVMKL